MGKVSASRQIVLVGGEFFRLQVGGIFCMEVEGRVKFILPDP